VTANAQEAFYSQAEAEDIFQKANEAYYRQDYAAAKEGYKKLLEHGLGGPDVLFNMGTSCLAKGDLGEAVLYLERARKVASRVSDIDANLEVARGRLVDKALQARVEVPLAERLVSQTSGSAAAWVFLLAWMVGMGLLLLRRLSLKFRRAWVWMAACCFLALSLPAGALVALHLNSHLRVREAVVLRESLPLREFPDEGAKASLEIHAGLKLRVLEKAGAYARVRLSNGLEGWVTQEGVEEL
jgi:hypothetical protein